MPIITIWHGEKNIGSYVADGDGVPNEGHILLLERQSLWEVTQVFWMLNRSKTPTGSEVDGVDLYVKPWVERKVEGEKQ